MILFNCSCGLRHSFFHPCNGTIDINSIAEEKDPNEDFAEDVKKELEEGWTDPIRQTKIEP